MRVYIKILIIVVTLATTRIALNEGGKDIPNQGLPQLPKVSLYSNESPFKQLIPEDAKLDPDSDIMMQSMLEAYEKGGFYIAREGWTVAVYFADSNTPRYDVELTAPWAPAKVLKNVPIPDDAVPDSKEGHMSIIDRDSGCEYDFWLSKKENGRWSAAWANAISIDGDGVYPYGYSCRGSGFALLAGVIWPRELKLKRIDHALIFSYPFPKAGGPVEPATESDGNSYREDAIPEGARLQLDPELDLDSLNLTPYEMTIARALQEYGMILGDNGGSGIELEAAIKTVDEEKCPYGEVLPQTDIVYLRNIPIEHFRVLELPPQTSPEKKIVPNACSEWEY
ncbi:hypothetical protein SAMN02745945_02647 [Peptoclostridium litorale DSM 5388]|uniref:Uncharacterized protein n=2 Tax=Peptoclostridium litorale TaxID=1557 RepID=A0A069RKA0_PEPLI|nr:hypothetical protein CLIT_14c00780 [Peptoclostridium litorale DSM 5388]SIO30756.1 hypothetical protein SAMN02745945_02647 [Peptoclostridium litorale DSM 5388]